MGDESFEMRDEDFLGEREKRIEECLFDGEMRMDRFQDRFWDGIDSRIK